MPPKDFENYRNFLMSRIDQQWLRGLVYTHLSSWLDDWRCMWRQKHYVPWQEYLLWRIDGLVMEEHEQALQQQGRA